MTGNAVGFATDNEHAPVGIRTRAPGSTGRDHRPLDHRGSGRRQSSRANYLLPSIWNPETRSPRNVLPASLGLRLERGKQRDDQDDRHEPGRQDERRRDRRHRHHARGRKVRREKRNHDGEYRGNREADESSEESASDLPLLGRRERHKEERGESFREDPELDLPDQDGDEEEGGEQLDSEDERVHDDVYGAQAQQPDASLPSSMRGPGEDQKRHIDHEGKR